MALRQDLHSLAGPYALDALDSGAEQDRFERHLNRCQNCTGEVRGFRETATRLGMAAAQTPPAEMRDRVMAAVARTRQLPVTDDHARHARPAAPRTRPLTRLAMAGAALAAAAAIVLGIALVNTQHRLNQAQHQLSQTQEQLAAITAVQTATDAKVITKRTSVGGTVTVTSSASKHQMVLRTVRAADADSRQGLPALADRASAQQDSVGRPAGHPAQRPHRARAHLRGARGRHLRRDRRTGWRDHSAHRHADCRRPAPVLASSPIAPSAGRVRPAGGSATASPRCSQTVPLRRRPHRTALSAAAPNRPALDESRGAEPLRS